MAEERKDDDMAKLPFTTLRNCNFWLNFSKKSYKIDKIGKLYDFFAKETEAFSLIVI